MGKLAFFKYCSFLLLVATFIVAVSARTYTITELMSTSLDGFYVNVEGVVVGFASDGNPADGIKGVIVMDNTTGKMVVVRGLGAWPKKGE